MAGIGAADAAAVRFDEAGSGTRGGGLAGRRASMETSYKVGAAILAILGLGALGVGLASHFGNFSTFNKIPLYGRAILWGGSAALLIVSGVTVCRGKHTAKKAEMTFRPHFAPRMDVRPDHTMFN
ncbi:MAG: hypothetical protein H7A36_06635 [Chlamydiales bacterium]|nr:hypothetical protein [Chlamydiales bacterium]